MMALNGLTWVTVYAFLLTFSSLVPACRRAQDAPPNPTNATDYPGVPQSNNYEVTVDEGTGPRKQVVFQSTCPEYQPGFMKMKPVDQYPLEIYKGQSISWVNFSFTGQVKIRVRVLGKGKAPLTDAVRILPSRYGVTPTVHGNVINFTMTKPGQCSVEIGADGHKQGLLIFANPPETDKPDPVAENMQVLDSAGRTELDAVPASRAGLYFKHGVHDIGVYHVPPQIKKIYLEAGSWVYGAIIMDGQPDVKIYGRGVLSQARLNYRESHSVEAINHSDRITLEGIVIADTKFFSVRLIGENNIVSWVKVVGGWTYNTDGISAFAGSRVSDCFIRGNDDSIKVYRSNLAISDCVVWQMNNGAVIQLSWGSGNSTDVTIKNVDVLHAEWNNNAANRGIVSCIGDKFSVGGMTGLQQSFLIENVTTETPVPFIFNIRPNPVSPNQIHGMIFKNWNIKMDMSKNYSNYIMGGDPANKYDGFVFNNFTINGVALTESNWMSEGRFIVKNLATPVFK